MARSSSSVMAASCSRALARAAACFISRFGIESHLQLRRLAETDHTNFVVATPNEDPVGVSRRRISCEPQARNCRATMRDVFELLDFRRSRGTWLMIA